MIKQLLTSILFGAIIGLSTTLYTLVLVKINLFHQINFMYPMFLVVIFLSLIFLKRNTLYFPTTVRDVVTANVVEQRNWSRASYPVNLFGSWLSHLAGASLGREGTSVVLASSLSQLFKLDWAYYQAIVISAAFACVVDQPIIAVVVISELFSSNLNQKIFSFIMAWVGILVLKSFNVKPLFSLLAVDLSSGFMDKVFFVIFIGLVAGIITHLYKHSYMYLSDYFKKNRIISVLVLLIVTWIFIHPTLKPVHSLSLNTLNEISLGDADFKFLALKLIFTLLFVSLGFVGGDFVPLVIIGSGLGVLIAKYLGLDYTFGLAVGGLTFFTGVTRLKWTSVCLVFILSGFSVAVWAYFCLSITRKLSGSISLYKKVNT